MSSLSENLFQAVDILLSSRMHDMQYDKTVLCKIESSTDKEKGEYIVTDGASRFVAYSENTSYQDGTSVYVTIPGGDYNQRKLIAGRYVEDNGEHFTYRAPFEDYLDITENLIEDDVPVSSLLANGENKEVVLWSRNFEQERIDSGEEDYVGIGKGYQTLGITAKFRSWLAALSPVSGSYGLRLDVVGRETATSKTEATEKYYSFYLTTEDMFGSVYNFETWYAQEKIFDISMIEEIARLQLVFYQDKNFYDKEGNLIPTKKGEDILPNNLFVKEPYVSFGYNLHSFTEDTILLYSFDSLTYTPQASPEQNTKRLMARWIHFNEDGSITAIDKASEIPVDAKLHWYKFHLTEGVTDELAGNFWAEITEPELLNQLYFKFTPDIAKQNEKYKIIVEYPSREVIQRDIDDGLAIYEASKSDYASEEEWQAAVDTFVLEQHSRVMYLYSDVFTFENEVACVNDATVDLVQALQIVCDPKEKGGLQGNYCIYDMTNELLNPTEGRKIRQLEATYKSLVTGEESLDKAASITWKIPIANTMIYMPEEGVEFITEVEEGSDVIPDEVMNDGTFMYITRTGTEDYDVDPEVTELQIEVLQKFRIKSYYTQNATNNTIYCSIVKNNRTYEASTTLAFGPMGTNGTDVTLIPTLADNQSAIKMGQSINVDAKLYDYENKEIPIEKIKWSWWSTDGNIALSNADANPCTITASEEGPIYHNILRATVTHNEIDLEAYLPIPVKSSDTVKFAEVPSRVVYDANGSNAAYFKNPLRVIEQDDNTEIEGTWEMILEDDVNSNAKYYPHVETANGVTKMIPPSMFFNDLDKGVTLVFNSKNEFWYQPILIIQNRWPSAMLNSWDGSLTIDEENGTILSTMVGAGKKESDNTYTGVLMGDVESGSGDKTIKKTGVYGYNHGMQSFGFMDDGTAFIGKVGKGRIVFDGNEGRIASMSRSQNEKAGMLIDLDDGYIDILGVDVGGVTGTNGYFSNPSYKESGSHVRIDVKDPYLTIETAAADGVDGKPSEIMHVGVGKYFLQSADYNEKSGEQRGTKLDIGKGIYTAYDQNGSGSYIRMNSDTTKDSFLEVRYKYQDIDKTIDSELIHCGGNKFFLQSADYDAGDKIGTHLNISKGEYIAYDKDGSGSFIKLDSDADSAFLTVHYSRSDTEGTYNQDLIKCGGTTFFLQSRDFEESSTNKIGTKLDIARGKYTSYDREGTGNYVKIDSSSTNLFQIGVQNPDDPNKKVVPIFNVGENSFYLRTANYSMANHKGMEINLGTGRLNAYDFNITAYNGDDTSQYISVKSDTSGYPLDIAGAFKVAWDGSFRGANGLFQVDQYGRLTATKGKIGGWYITDTAITNVKPADYDTVSTYNMRAGARAASTRTILDGTTGQIDAGYGNFNVTPAGKVTAKNINISGSGSTATDLTISKAFINDCTITTGSINKAAITEGTIETATIDDCTIQNCSISETGMTLGTTPISKNEISFVTGGELTVSTSAHRVIYSLDGTYDEVDAEWWTSAQVLCALSYKYKSLKIPYYYSLKLFKQKITTLSTAAAEDTAATITGTFNASSTDYGSADVSYSVPDVNG